MSHQEAITCPLDEKSRQEGREAWPMPSLGKAPQSYPAAFLTSFLLIPRLSRNENNYPTYSSHTAQNSTALPEDVHGPPEDYRGQQDSDSDSVLMNILEETTKLDR